MTGDALAALPPVLVPAGVFVLVLGATVGLLYLVFERRLSGRHALLRRLELAGGADAKSASSAGTISEHRRKQSIEKALAEMARRERARQRARLTLPLRLGQAGLAWTTAGFYLRAASAALAAGAALRFGIGLALVLAVPLGGAAGFGALHAFVRSRRTARMRRFLREFPNAIDIVTRGVRAGLPLGDCLRAIADDGQEPVRAEFRRIVDDIAVGLSLGHALTRFARRVPVMEANFFAIVIAMQSRLGGNLSEALGNLATVLRERRMMKEKIRALSSEAVSSAAIIASMPVVVAGVLALTSPDYIGLLFSEVIGNVVLGASGVWMIIGVIVMRKMISFDF